MQRTAPGLRTNPSARLAELERRRPEWHAWLRLLGEAEHALDDVGWRAPLADTEPGGTSTGSSQETPLLNGRTLRVDANRVQRLLCRLASTAAAGHLMDAASLRRYRPSEAQAMRLLAAAVRQDLVELGAMADVAGVDRGALTSVAHLTAFPLLQSCGRLLEDHVPRFWPQGYCPVCAAWPILAERRGLDRTRRLRCGRCGGEWEVQWLCCSYCGEREHERLGSLVPEEHGDMLKVETCASCKGYLKSFATLQEIHPFELLLKDLETIELDLVALDRGYLRPEKNGFSLEVRLE
ncbi:MAG TPA: formate dehydrogenase accessory protein FdhE [Gemmatimonadales bacterium]|nr:formate dehydrogenase accessory protein FdhE [Gemmatimonadales bacterium]